MLKLRFTKQQMLKWLKSIDVFRRYRASRAIEGLFPDDPNIKEIKKLCYDLGLEPVKNTER